MYIYISYFFILLIGAIVKKGNAKKQNDIQHLIILAMALILMIGLRAQSIGMDTSQYAYIWDYGIKAGNYGYISTEAEYGYYILQTFCKQFMDYQFFLLVIATISIVPISWCIYKYSNKWPLSLLIFYASIPFHTLEFAAARQCIAFTGIIIAYHFLMNRELKKYLVAIGISCLFHQSAIVFLPCYWLYDVRINKKMILLWGSFLSMSFWLANTIFSFLNSFSRIDYSDSDIAVGGNRLFMVTLLFVLFGFIGKDKINENMGIKLPFLIYSIGPLLWPVLNGNPALYRLQYYFDFFLCLYVPNLLYVLPKGNKAKYMLLGLTIFVSLYVVLYLRTSEAYYPYKFFWEK